MKRSLIAMPAMFGLAAPAAADSIGPGLTWNGQSFGDRIYQQLQGSQMVHIPISFHKNRINHGGGFGDDNNWAGVKFHINVDPTEANFVGWKPNPFFPGQFTQGPNSSTFWRAEAYNSGIMWTQMMLSIPRQLGSFNVHIKGSSPGGNDGVPDLTFKSTVFNIYHVKGGEFQPSSYLPQSWWVYLPPGLQTSQWGYGFPPPHPGEGVWKHLEVPHHLPFGAQQSWFYGTPFNIQHQGSVFLNHVPVPAAFAMLAGGLGFIGIGRRRRRADASG